MSSTHTHKHPHALLAVAIAATSITAVFAWQGASLTTSAQVLGAACQTINQQSAIDKKYGSPVDFFLSPGTLLMSVMCGEKDAVAHLGTGNSAQYIYKYGYERVGSSWKKITFTGAKTAGSWVIGSAAASVTLPGRGEKGKVLAYICQNVRGVWKCGCADAVCASPKWQIQEYEQPEELPEEVTVDDLRAVVDDDYLAVYGPASTTKTMVTAGSKMTYTGDGFSKGVQMHFGNPAGTVATVPVQVLNMETIEFSIPNIAPGVYTTWFTQGEKRSKNIPFLINTPNPKPLRISKVSPDLLVNDTQVTVYGEGFESTNNLVYVSAFPFYGIPSPDGKTLTFTLRPKKLTEHDIAQEVRAFLPQETIEQVMNLDHIPSTGKEIDLTLQVINANGFSDVYTVRFK